MQNDNNKLAHDNEKMISRTSLYVIDANYAGDGEFYVRGVVFDKGDKKTVAVRLKNQIEREIYWGDAYKDNPVLAAAKISQENEDLSRKGVHNKNTLPDLINKGLMKAFEEKQISQLPQTFDFQKENLNVVMLFNNMEITHTDGDYNIATATRGKISTITNNDTPSVNLRGMMAFHAQKDDGGVLKHKLKLMQEAVNLNGQQLTHVGSGRDFNQTIEHGLTNSYEKYGVPEAERTGALEMSVSFPVVVTAELKEYINLAQKQVMTQDGGLELQEADQQEIEEGDTFRFNMRHTIVPKRLIQQGSHSLSLDEFKADTVANTMGKIMGDRYLMKGEQDNNQRRLKDGIFKMLKDFSDNKENMAPVPQQGHPLLKALQQTLLQDPKKLMVSLSVSDIIPMTATLASKVNGAKMSESYHKFNKAMEAEGIPEALRGLERYKAYNSETPNPSLNNFYIKKNKDHTWTTEQICFPADINALPMVKTNEDGTKSTFLAATSVSGVFNFVPPVGLENNKYTKESLTFYDKTFYPSHQINHAFNAFTTDSASVSMLIEPQIDNIQKMKQGMPLSRSQEQAVHLPMHALPPVQKSQPSEPIPDPSLIETVTKRQVQMLAAFLGNKPKKDDPAITMTDLEVSQITRITEREKVESKRKFNQLINGDPELKDLYKGMEHEVASQYGFKKGMYNNLMRELNAEAGFSNDKPLLNILKDYERLFQAAINKDSMLANTAKVVLDNDKGIEYTIKPEKAKQLDTIFEAKQSVDITPADVAMNVEKLIGDVMSKNQGVEANINDLISSTFEQTNQTKNVEANTDNLLNETMQTKSRGLTR